MQMRDKKTQAIARDSGIELMKVFAIFIIVISHVVHTLCLENSIITYHDYVLDLSLATTNIQQFILILFNHFGILGNWIFFVSSAWFLLRSTQFKKRKWLFMLVEIWVISVLIFTGAYFALGGNVTPKLIVSSFVPTLAGNNWYLTCYLLFYPIHPLLNSIIQKQSKSSLFRLALAMFFLYSVMNSLRENLFFFSRILLWISVYLIIGYMQRYSTRFCDSLKKNGLLLLFGLVGFVGLVVITNFLGLHVSFLRNKMRYWVTNSNPFLIVIAIAMLNIARNVRFNSAAVNYLSSLSMLIYIIHDNIILRTYFRPLLLQVIYEKYGYDHILLWVIVLGTAIFTGTAILAVFYDKTLRRLVRRLSESLYPIIRRMYLCVENRIINRS